MHGFSFEIHHFSSTLYSELAPVPELAPGRPLGRSTLEIAALASSKPWQNHGKTMAKPWVPDLAPFTLKEGRRGRPGQPLERFTSAYSGEIHEGQPEAPCPTFVIF